MKWSVLWWYANLISMVMEFPLCERHERTASVLRQTYKIDEAAGLSAWTKFDEN